MHQKQSQMLSFMRIVYEDYYFLLEIFPLISYKTYSV